MTGLAATNLPGDILDGNLITCLLVIIIPFTLRQVDARERGGRVNSLRRPVTLLHMISRRNIHSKSEGNLRQA